MKYMNFFSEWSRHQHVCGNRKHGRPKSN
jgi:hypothetical protein